MKHILYFLCTLPLAVLAIVSITMARISIPINRIMVEMFQIDCSITLGSDRKDSLWKEQNPWKYLGQSYWSTIRLLGFSIVVLFPVFLSVLCVMPMVLD